MEAKRQIHDTQAFASQQALTESWARLASRFQELHRLNLTLYDSPEAQYADYLTTGAQLLDMEIGIVSRIENDDYTILAVEPADAGMYAGQRFELPDTYCAWVVEKGGPVALDHIGADEAASRHPVYRTARLEAYLGAPIWVEGRIFGTLNFTHTQPRQTPFNEHDWELVELMARALGQVIAQNLLEQRREAATQLMRENVDLFESAFKYASNGIALVAPDGRWLRVNQAVSDMLGYSNGELLTIDFQAITHPDDLAADLCYVQDMLAGKRDAYRFEKRYYHSEGHIVWVMLSVSLVRREDGSPRYFISQLQDISEQKRALEELLQKRSQLELANRRLRQLATRDALTQVLNRRAFDERLATEIERSLRSGLPISLLLLDVDRFKQYNDDFGHPAGDKALQQVARSLMAEGRIDDIVARYGGEEFAVILPDTDASGCQIVAERLRLAVRGLDELQRMLTISIGSATLEAGAPHVAGVTADFVVARADEALYKAKAAGRDQCQHAVVSVLQERPDHKLVPVPGSRKTA